MVSPRPFSRFRGRKVNCRLSLRIPGPEVARERGNHASVEPDRGRPWMIAMLLNERRVHFGLAFRCVMLRCCLPHARLTVGDFRRVCAEPGAGSRLSISFVLVSDEVGEHVSHQPLALLCGRQPEVLAGYPPNGLGHVVRDGLGRKDAEIRNAIA